MKPSLLPKEFYDEFDHKKNDIKISQIRKFSSEKIWWICKEGHSWKVSPHARNHVHHITKKKYITRCPICSLKEVGKKGRSELPQQFIEEFDHKKNKIKLEKLTKTYSKRIWWKCKKGHVWQAPPAARLRYGGRSEKDEREISLCPTCQKLGTLKVKDHVRKYFNPKLNPNIILEELPQKSTVVINWQCPKNSSHKWSGQYNSRANKESSCPFCKGNKIEDKYLLKNLYPNVFSKIIKDNKKINYEELSSGAKTLVKFKCPNGNDHIFTNAIVRMTKYNRSFTKQKANKHDKLNCPYCRNDRLSVTNSLNITHPKLANIFNEKKNKIKINKVLFVSSKKYWWNCKKKGHVFYAQTYNVQRSLNTKYNGCNICTGRKLDKSNSFKINYPKLFKEIHKSKNKKIDLNSLTISSTKYIYWQCPNVKDHVWKNKVYLRINQKCPYCTNYKLHKTNSLGYLYPEIAKQLHPSLNKNLDTYQIKATDNKEKYYWVCKINKEHIYEDTIRDQAILNLGCPLCSKSFRWNRNTLKAFLISIRDHIGSLTPAEKFLIFQQTGMPDRRTSTSNFIKNFATGKFPIEEIDKFISGKKSLVDDFIENEEIKIDTTENNEKIDNKDKEYSDSNKDDEINETVKNIVDDIEESDDGLPNIKTKQILKTLSYLVRNVNQEAIEFLIASAKHKIWKDVFRNEVQAIKDLKRPDKDEYVKRVQSEFLNEFKRAKTLSLPKGYSFPHKPNLMQKLTAAKVIHEKRVGNWSGTGAGKTLSAVLASRYIDAKNIVVCCPNALAQQMDTGWANEIISIFPDSNVQLKSFEPLKTKVNNYYVLNYESFQQKDSSKKIFEFLKNVKVDFVIIDEIHFSKQRVVDNLSLRKKNITSMLAEINKKNKKLHVLGMSATPVINNLYEGRSLVEMITGEVHKDLSTQININNCMKLHQKLATVGLRWMPDYKMKLTTKIEEVDCTHITDQVRELGKNPTPLELEIILTREKIKTIKKHLEPKTLIYTHYLSDIDNYLKEEIEKEGYSVGMFTGEDKSGLEEFKNGSLDILIGSRTIGTGVNGLQNVCRKIIINSLPWTNAEFEQLIGRVYRQGQKKDVEIIIPLTEGIVNGEKWSWCKSRYDRIKFKKTVGDAAVDGIIPSDQIRTENQVLQDLMKWIERISNENDLEVKREPIKSEFIFNDSDQVKRIAKFGDFSKMNRDWNNSRSFTTNQKIKNNPDIWKHYHQLFEERKKTWTVVPTSELIKYFKVRDGLEIGDFGCGKALLHERLSEKHVVHSFDHYSFNKHVTACDISKTPLNDKQIDVAIYSLSMMGTNIADYVKEANRTLKLDGRLFIIEASIRFKDMIQFKRQLIQFGFDHLSVKEIGKFTQIKADKIKDIDVNFNGELNF